MRLMIRKFRREQELSIEELAAKAKVSPNTIYRIEHGANIVVRSNTLLQLAKALGVTVADLISE